MFAIRIAHVMPTNKLNKNNRIGLYISRLIRLRTKIKRAIYEMHQDDA